MVATTNNDYNPASALVALCRLLLPNEPSLELEVRQAVDRGGAEVGWSALLDGLQTRDRLLDVDWGADPWETTRVVDVLLRDRPADPDRWRWVDMAQWAHAPVATFLNAIGERLLQQELVLTDFDLGTDSYTLAIVDALKITELQAIAKRMGIPVETCPFEIAG